MRIRAISLCFFFFFWSFELHRFTVGDLAVKGPPLLTLVKIRGIPRGVPPLDLLSLSCPLCERFHCTGHTG